MNDSKIQDPIRIKKYANRRLYNTATSTYVTLDDLSEMVKEGSDFVVNDAKSGEDITHSVLTQIIFEQENKGQNLLPIPFLRQLIRFYGNSIQSMVPSYLELSLDQLAQEQGKMRRQMTDAFGTNPMEIMEEQVRQNLTMFHDAMKMFTPFPGADSAAGQGDAKERAAKERAAEQAATGGGAPAPEPAAKNDRDNDLSTLKDQLSAMQAQLDKLAGDKKG